MSDDRLNLTGMWDGTYVYPGFAGPTTPFVANLTDSGGSLTGTTLEPNTHGFFDAPDELEATVAGARSERAVDFTKTYCGGPIEDPIDYVGQLSEDGNLITGVWSVLDMDGTFEMRRGIALEELSEVREEAQMPVVQTTEPIPAP